MDLGKGDGGRLGFGHENSVFLPILIWTRFEALLLAGFILSLLTPLGRSSLGVTVALVLLVIQFFIELVPRLVEGSWDAEICHIATSGTHTAAITKSGELYTWGQDEGDGRLGLGPGRGPNEAGGLSIPSKVKSLPVSVAAVSCGGFFTMALSEEGELWNWGANSNYELGRGGKVGGWKPQPVPNLEGVRVIQIASGGYHSLALTDKGEVLSWGHGGHGQLGNYPVEMVGNCTCGAIQKIANLVFRDSC